MRIYLDHNATTPLASQCAAVMAPWLQPGVAANASSVHGEGRLARDAVETAREHIAAAIGAAAGREIILTSGATEANNTVLRGVAGDSHVVVSAGEHPSVLDVARQLGRVSEVPLTPGGEVTPDAVAAAIQPETALCSIIWVNNETGVINDIAAIGAICRDKGVPFHVDAAQALGKLSVDVGRVECDFLTLSSHKVYGPQGAGALWVRSGSEVAALLTGGHQERGRRAGTENTAAVVGFGAACERLDAVLGAQTRVAELRDRLWELLQPLGTRRNGRPERSVANTLNLSFDGAEGETLLIALDLAGIAVSTGSACTAGSLEASHVLLAMGLDTDRATSALRFSLGTDTTAAQIDHTADELRRILGRTRSDLWAPV